MNWCGMNRVASGNAWTGPRRRRRTRDARLRGCGWIVVGACVAAAAVTLFSRRAGGEAHAPGVALVRCGDRASAAREFSAHWRENPLLEGLTDRGGRAELFASAARTWSFIVTDPSGRACLLAFGRALGPAINLEPEGETP